MKHVTGWCFALAVVAVATAGHPSSALPNSPSYNFGSGLRRFEETVYQGDDNTISPSADDTTAKPQENPEQRLSTLMRAIQKQMQLQENLMRPLVREVQDYLKSVSQGWDVSQVEAGDIVQRMLEMMGSRMAATAGSVADFINSGNMDGGVMRETARKFMKEASLQDVVIDAVWAALRGVQTGAWMAGIGAIENAEPLPVPYQAAEEFFTRVTQNMRTAGVAEEDLRKFVPKIDEVTMNQKTRKMGKRGYGYGYGGYGYGRGYGYYGYGYPAYYSYGYSSYPSYYSYGYAYPSYYSYGYPSYYGYAYPYYASYYYRRLRREPPYPMMPPMGMPMPMGPSQQGPMQGFRALYEETPTPMPMEPMMEGQVYGPPMEYAEDMPTADYYTEPDMMPMPRPNTFYEDTTAAYTGARRSLAPMDEFTRIPPAGASWLPF